MKLLSIITFSFLCFGLILQAQKLSSPAYIPAYTVGTLPSASTYSGYSVFVTNGTDATCAVAGGTTICLMQSNGTSWSPISGAGSGFAFNDFQTTVSGHILTVNANCSSSTPCKAKVGSTVYQFTTSTSVTLSGSTSGIVYEWIDQNGNINFGSTATLSCSSGATCNSGTSAFPSNVLQLYTWPSTGGAFVSNAQTDLRALLSNNILVGGTGITATQGSNGLWTIAATYVGPTYYGMLSYSTVTQTIPSGSPGTLSLLFNANDANAYTGSMHSTSANTNEFIAPVNGHYRGVCQMANNNANGTLIYVYLNGSTQVAASSPAGTLSGGSSINAPFDEIYLAAGQYLTCSAVSYAGTSVTVSSGEGNTFFAISYEGY